MNLLDFLFECGIVYVVFSFIWSFFMFMYNALIQFRTKGMTETYVIKFLNTYVLISLIAILTTGYMAKPMLMPGLYASVGLLTMYSYLIGRLERNRMILQFNRQVLKIGGTDALNMKLEMILVTTGLIYYVVCLTRPEVAVNPVTLWFNKAIHQLYDTPVIGWIFAFIGVIMLISLLIRSVIYTSMLLSGARRSGSRKDNKRNDNDDDFTDYEILE